MPSIAAATQRDEDPDSRLHRLLIIFNKGNRRQRSRALPEIWKEHGDYFLRCMFKHANKMGGTERGFYQDAILEYRTAGEQNGDVKGFEGVMDHTMADANLRIRKADDREGYLEAELRSAAFLLFLKAAKKFDPKRGVPFRGFYWKIARHAVIDVKRRLPAGLTRRPEMAEPKSGRTEPYDDELNADAITERILRARSEAYLRRWGKSADAIDRDIIKLHLIRSPLCDGKRPPFHSLQAIADRHGISRQSAAKRRKRIETELINKGSTDGASGKRYGSYIDRLSNFSDVRICFEGAGNTTVLDLIHEYEIAQNKFARGTSFNLYWRPGPKIFGRVDQSVQRLAAIAGTPESVYAMLSERGREALQEMRRIENELANTQYGRRNRPDKPNLPSFYQSTGYTHLGPRQKLVPGPILELRARMRREVGPFNPAYPPIIPHEYRGSFSLANNLMVTRPLGVCLNYHCRSQLVEQGSTRAYIVTNNHIRA